MTGPGFEAADHFARGAIAPLDCTPTYRAPVRVDGPMGNRLDIAPLLSGVTVRPFRLSHHKTAIRHRGCGQDAPPGLDTLRSSVTRTVDARSFVTIRAYLSIREASMAR